MFVLTIFILVTAFYSYLRKPSVFWCENQFFKFGGNVGPSQLCGVCNSGARPGYILLNKNFPKLQYRRMRDVIVYSSLVYAIAAIWAFILHESNISILCLMTSLSSTLYHINGEQLYFNFDNIFATTLLLLYTWSFLLSIQYYLSLAHVWCGLVGLPLAVYLLVASGMPGVIKIDTLTNECIRHQPSKYAPLHTIWHVVSGLGLILMSYYFYNVHKIITNSGLPNSWDCGFFFKGTALTLGSVCYFDSNQQFPVVSVLSLLISVFINILGNVIGIMPLN